MDRRLALGFVSLSILATPHVRAQASGPCLDAGALGFRLELSALDLLRRYEGSPFAQAYLLNLVLENVPDTTHALQRETRAFLRASPERLVAADGPRAPSARRVLDALQCEEQRVAELLRAAARFGSSPLLAHVEVEPERAVRRLRDLQEVLRAERTAFDAQRYAQPTYDAIRQALDEALAYADALAAEEAAATAAHQRAPAWRLAAAELATSLREAAHVESLRTAGGPPSAPWSTHLDEAQAAGQALEALDGPDADEAQTVHHRVETLYRQVVEALAVAERTGGEAGPADTAHVAGVRERRNDVQAAGARMAEAWRPYDEALSAEAAAARRLGPPEGRPAAAFARLTAVGAAIRGLPDVLQSQVGRALTEHAAEVEQGPARLATPLAVPEPEAAAPVALTPPQAPANLAFAFVDFAVRRAQEELVLAYLEDLTRWFDDPSGTGPLTLPQAVGVAFTSTRLLLRSARPDVLAIPRPMWRAALLDDLRRFPERALSNERLVQALAAAAPFDAAAPPIADLQVHARRLGVVYHVARRVGEGASPLDLLIGMEGQVAHLALGGDVQPVVEGTARLVATLALDYRAHGLRDAGAAPPYVLSLRAFDQARGRQVDLFTRLLVADAFRGIRTPPWGTPPELIAFGARIRDVLGTVEDTQTHLASLRSSSPEGYAAYVAAAISQADVVLDLAAAALDDRCAGASSPSEPLCALRVQWGRIAAIESALHQRAYLDALTSTVTLYSEVVGRPFPPHVRQLSALAAALASAEDGAQMESAFRAAALPAGGYRYKRRGESGRVAITAFPGLRVGYERVMRGGGTAQDEAGAYAIGATLPVGVEVRPFLSAPTFSIYIPVVDLGAVLSYRFSREGDDTSELPNVSLTQLLSPGLFVMWGPPSQPLAIGIGAQLTPELRSFSTPTGEEQRGDALLLGGFVSIDLTLFQF